jgi:hypothetical protein
MDSEIRTFLQTFFLQCILPLLDPYWANLFRQRANDDLKTTELSVCNDFFKPIQVVTDEKKGSKEIMCVIPVEDAKPFWDVCISFYPLFFPKIFDTPAYTALLLLRMLKDILKPMNLNNDVMTYLIQLAEGQTHPGFFKYPMEYVCAIKVLHLMAVNYPSQNPTKEKLDEFNQNVEKWKDQAIAEETINLKEWEEKWQKLLLKAELD